MTSPIETRAPAGAPTGFVEFNASGASGASTRAAARSAAEEARAEALALLGHGDFAAALSIYDTALGSARLTGDPSFVDWIYACRATAAAELGPADTELVELKRILLRTGEAETAFRAAYTSARAYELRREYRKALFYNRIARQHAEALAAPALRGYAENQLGNLLTADSAFAEAEEAYRRALETADGVEGFTSVFRAVISDNLGYCLLALDRVPEGLKTVHDAFDVLESSGATGFTVYPLLDLCYGYSKLDRLAEARYFGEAGLERVSLSPDETVEKNLLYLLGEVCHLSGDDDAAETYFDRLAAHYPDFRNLRAYLDVFDFRNVINLRS